MTTNPQNPMDLTHLNAIPLLREAVRLNILARHFDKPTRFSQERDEILADLRAAGCPTNVDDYSHPSEV